ncbi:hypothetical protein K438DRAFT_1783170 [Mycena galopus ATCC 62051]|nr:hypothetical protein K438DRAFT_1783170 [Mycena galopus ATCC 62051]
MPRLPAAGEAFKPEDLIVQIIDGHPEGGPRIKVGVRGHEAAVAGGLADIPVLAEVHNPQDRHLLTLVKEGNIGTVIRPERPVVATGVGAVTAARGKRKELKEAMVSRDAGRLGVAFCTLVGVGIRVTEINHRQGPFIGTLGSLTTTGDIEDSPTRLNSTRVPSELNVLISNTEYYLQNNKARHSAIRCEGNELWEIHGNYG